MRRVVIDSCAVDPLVDLTGAFEAAQRAIDRGELEILYTHVTLTELAKTNDPERRSRLLKVVTVLGRQVATGGFILGVSSLGSARLSAEADVPVIDDLRSNSVDHSMDALIAITARFEGCALLTNEKRRLPNRARGQGIEVLSTDQFFRELGFALEPSDP